jgi:ceramide glucosyltransferase
MAWIAAWTVLFGLLTAVRLGLAGWYARRMARLQAANEAAPKPSITIVQPILSGDPALAHCLESNLAHNPDAHFLWLVDQDDIQGGALAGGLRKQHGERVAISVVAGPGPSDGENPKMAKLIRAAPQVATAVLLVLDDDTILPPGGAAALARLAHGTTLATGLPVYAPHASMTERLVAGFINGQAMAVYFAMAALGASQTINGMVYAIRTGALAQAGGFSAAGHELTDDYAIARLWCAQGGSLLQSAVFCCVVISFKTPLAAGRVLRRWFIFANRYLVRNRGLATLAFVLLPSLLPAAGLGLAVAAGWRGGALWGGALGLKALLNGLLLRQFAGVRLSAIQTLCEIAADVLTPFVYLSSLVRPSRLTWRTRRIDTSCGTIRYR